MGWIERFRSFKNVHLAPASGSFFRVRLFFLPETQEGGFPSFDNFFVSTQAAAIIV
jgi:hypothetical protein